LNTKEQMNPQKTARIAALLYILSIPFQVFGFFYVPSKLIVAGDAAKTASNILSSEGLFRAGMVAWLVGMLFYILLIPLLYKLFKPVNKYMALLMAVFILIEVPIVFINELNNLAALQVLSSAAYLQVFTPQQLQAQALLFVNLREQGVFISNWFSGLWLLPIAYIVYKSDFIPKILGVLVGIAGFGYLADAVTFLLFPDFHVRFASFLFVGELLLPLWLLFKGVNVERWKKRALESDQI
jgi:hypothetical protein